MENIIYGEFLSQDHLLRSPVCQQIQPFNGKQSGNVELLQRREEQFDDCKKKFSLEMSTNHNTSELKEVAKEIK